MLEARLSRAPKAQKRKATYQQSVPGKAQSSKVTEIALQVHRRLKHQPMTIRPTNTSENYMAKGKHRNITNRNQGTMAASEPISTTTASPGYPNTPEKQDSDLKSHLMMLMTQERLK